MRKVIVRNQDALEKYDECKRLLVYHALAAPCLP